MLSMREGEGEKEKESSEVQQLSRLLDFEERILSINPQLGGLFCVTRCLLITSPWFHCGALEVRGKTDVCAFETLIGKVSFLGEEVC
jgi:hypothetical protein